MDLNFSLSWRNDEDSHNNENVSYFEEKDFPLLLQV